MTVNRYPRESVEFAPIAVTVDGVPVLTGVTFAVVEDGARPVTFAAATTLSGKIGVMVTGMATGHWRVFAKVASSPETPVIDCGYFNVT